MGWQAFLSRDWTIDFDSGVEYLPPSYGDVPDSHWKHTDKAGHDHRYHIDGPSWPTLAYVVDDSYEAWDEYDGPYTITVASHYECRECGEHIKPGMTSGMFGGPPIQMRPRTATVTYRDYEHPMGVATVEFFVPEEDWPRIFAPTDAPTRGVVMAKLLREAKDRGDEIRIVKIETLDGWGTITYE